MVATAADGTQLTLTLQGDNVTGTVAGGQISGTVSQRGTAGLYRSRISDTETDVAIVAPDGSRSIAKLQIGKSYFRKAGVEHDVLNETKDTIVFLEVELKA